MKASIIATADPGSSALDERLRAHASLCRRIASRCWNEEIALELERLAQFCLTAADISDKARH